jgi:predicted nuclease of predicted toxin-antitoxin system
VKFFLDHDVPRAIREALERHGFEVAQVTDVFPRDAADDVIFNHAAKNGCVMITCNRNDFLELAGKSAHSGLIILIRRRADTAECGKLLQLIRKAGENGLAGNINFA